jgi:cellulose biosynthesis protein BcsQ
VSILSEFNEYIRSLFELAKHVPPEKLAVVVVGSLALGGTAGWYARRLFARQRQGELLPPRNLAPPVPDTSIERLRVRIGELEEHVEALRMKLGELQGERDGLKQQMKADQAVLDLMQENEGEIWRLFNARPPATYAPPFNTSRPKIVMIANNKGGVGKTTLTAYLTAYFLSKRKRVLVIDLDHQGSLTGWLLSAGGIIIPDGQQHRLALANRVLSSDPLQDWPAEVLGGQLGGTQLITADYTLTQYETKLMLRWLRQLGEPDIRYNLAQVLMSKSVQSELTGFDIVLVDAPPRLTTGAINALAACTHLLVPTKLDALSAETVGSFLRQVATLRRQLNLGFELAGVVGTMTPAQPLDAELGDKQKEALAIVRMGIKEWPRDHYIFARDIQERAEIRNAAGRRVVWAGLTAEMINQVGDELSDRIGYRAMLSAEAAE